MNLNLPNKLVPKLAGLVRSSEQAVEYGPIGVDFGSQGLRLVQFRRQGEALSLQGSHYVPYPEDMDASCEKSMSRLLKRAIRRHGLRGSQAVTCLRDIDTSIFMLNYLLSADKDDESIIAQRMQDRLEGDISDYVIDYMLVRPEGGVAQERSALVAVAENDKVVRHLEILRKAGLEVDALEIEPMAIRRLISVRHRGESIANLLSVSIGKEQTYLTVLSGRRLIYEREIDFGEYDVISHVCRKLDMSPRQAIELLRISGLDVGAQSEDSLDELRMVLKPVFRELVEDINKALIYAASETRGMEVRKIYLTGTVSRWGCMVGSLQSMLEVDTGVLMPLDNFDGAGDWRNDTRNTVATGLALRGMTEVN